MESKNQENPQPQSDGGLYRNLKISPKALNSVIIGGLILLVVLCFLGTSNNGYTVHYNAKGGSDVEEQIYKYQEEWTAPADPTREGYTFNGWYLDESCANPAEDGMPVEGSLELYACWS